MIAVHAKRARGLMARFVAVNDCRTLDDLRAFDYDNYAFDATGSDDVTLVFNRSSAPPKAVAANAKPAAASRATKTKTTTKAIKSEAAARPSKRQRRN